MATADLAAVSAPANRVRDRVDRGGRGTGMVPGIPGRAWLLGPAAALSLAFVVGFAPAPAPQGLSAARFMQHVTVLASEDMKGRGNGTPELDRAAAYIAREFESYGLRPFGDHGGFLQEFPLALGATPRSSPALRIDGAAQRAGHDFLALPLSASGVFEGPAVFAGYGITAPESGWDDYEGLDVAGQAVVVLAHHPAPQLAATRALGVMSSLAMKARNARQHGAGAILFVVEPGVGPDTVTDHDTAHVVPHDLGLLAAYVSRRAVEPLFRRRGTTVAAARRGIDEGLRPASFALPGSSVRLAVDLHRSVTTAKNVLAAIPGADAAMRHEWLVIGAHYDHLGHGREHGVAPGTRGQIHHGADDNASGTAGLLELARSLARDRTSLRRSVLFVAFAGEEVGLVGSSHFVDHAPVPPASVAAMLNLDMIGRLATDPLHIMGSDVPAQLADWIRHENRQVGLTLAFSPGESASSDWAAFQAIGIPALTFFTGMHRDYHRPSDTADKINADGAMKVLAVVAGAARRIAGAGAAITRGPFPRTLDAIDDADPYFGAEPRAHRLLNALRFADVPRHSPAARAGLRSGDVVIQFGEFPIRTINDFRTTLESFRPGDMPAMDVLRRGRRLRLAVALEDRRTTPARRRP